MLDAITSYLFCDSFPREIGVKRNLANTQKYFEEKLDMINGVEDSFTNVNPLNGEINKIFIDFDGPDSLVESQIIYNYLISNGIPCIPVASGRKGIHLYILFKTRKGFDNKEILWKTTKSLLLKALPKSKSIDSHVIGDLRRLCRITNTLRPPNNSSYCTILPAGKAFLEMKNIDLSWYIKGTHTYPLEEYDVKHLPTFEEFILPEVASEQLKFEQIDLSPSVTYKDNEDLKHLLRPCLYRLMTVEEPRHLVRVAATADLLRSEISTRQIIDMYKTLGWSDFNFEYCQYQIEHTKQIQFSKKKLIQLGICHNCDRPCR